MAANYLKDIFVGIKLYLESILGSGVNVKLSFKDERAETGEDRKYPEATISFLDPRHDLQSRYSGINYFTKNLNTENNTIELYKPPEPMQLFFQIDSFCETREQDWMIMETMFNQFIGRKPQVTTPAGREYWLSSFGMDGPDKMVDGLFRRIYTIFTTVWIEDSDDPAIVNIVKELNLEINNKSNKIESA